MSKISGPLLDRIDIQLEVPRLKVAEITDKSKAESSGQIRERVEKARDYQKSRYAEDKISFNSELEASQIAKHCRVTEEGESLLKMAIQELGFSARAYHKVLKVARTIADLDASELIQPAHVSEAIHYRALDRNIWR